VPVPPDRQIKGRRLGDDRRVFTERSVPPINVTIGAARAAFRAPVPRIPEGHRRLLSVSLCFAFFHFYYTPIHPQRTVQKKMTLWTCRQNCRSIHKQPLSFV
jgi:hypothetical protein